ncbi:MAG: tyrosine-type recombinase/integrase, partial [Vulcanimicrobiaceae bacterium]
TMNDVFDKYERQIVPTKAERTQRDNRTELRWLRAYFGAMEPRSVRATHIASYRDARAGKVRANREIALLSHSFTYAVEWGDADFNPCLNVRRNKEEGRDRYITDQEIIDFKKLCPDKWQCYVDLKNVVAMRKQDMLQLTLLHVTDEGLASSIRKTDDIVVFTWNRELRAVVDRILQLQRPADCQWFFPTEGGDAYTESGFDSIWQSLQVNYAKRGGTRFTEHDIRAKVATDLTGDTDDLKKAQKRLVHGSEATTKKYVRRKRKEKLVRLDEPETLRNKRAHELAEARGTYTTHLAS